MAMYISCSSDVFWYICTQRIVLPWNFLGLQDFENLICAVIFMGISYSLPLNLSLLQFICVLHVVYRQSSKEEPASVCQENLLLCTCFCVPLCSLVRGIQINE
jgi:hypothetical protein